MPTTTLEQRVRERLPLYLSPEVGAVANMSVQQLQQTVAFSYFPSAEQLRALALRMRVI